ncbi:uncharacterized protein [Amphiura filiformis]|uniref:uncharacterized protein n=1 Tax=Amphiura filiformis TaxID=82378 RepID=UPI003B213B8F
MAGLPPNFAGGFGFPPPPGLLQQPPPENPMEFIAILKREGNNVIDSDPGTALELYSKCIEVDELFRVLADRERAIIHSNRSQAFMKLGDLGAAFHDAIDCVKIDPSYVKGYWRAAMVMKRMNRNEEALEALIDGLDHVRGSGPQQHITRVDFVYEITALSSILDGKWKKAEFLFRSINADTRVWTEVVKKLALRKEYKGMHLTLLGGGGRFEKGKGGMATGCSTKGIDIQTMLRGLSLMQLKDWGVKLIHQLIIQGADFNQFSLKESDTPLHCALKLALTNGWFLLFDYLLREKYTKPQSRNLLDRSGSSLYHMVAKSVGGHERRALESLRNYQVSPFLLDRQSRPPLYYATNEEVRLGIKFAIDFYNKPSQPAPTTQPQKRQQKPPFQPQTQQQKPPFQPHPQQQKPPFQPHPHQQKPPFQPHPQQQKPPFQPHPQQQKPPFQPHPQQQTPWPSGNERPKPKPQQPFRWETETQAHGYNTYTGQPYWETQQQQQKYGGYSQPQGPSEMEIQRKQEQKRLMMEEARRKEKEREEIEKQRRIAVELQKRTEEQRTRRAEEQKRKRAEDEKRRKAEAAEKRRIAEEKREKRQRQKEQKYRRQQDLRSQSLYQQGLHYAEQNEHIQAITCFAKFISENHANQFQLNDVERCRKAFAKQLVHVDEIPAEVECHDSPPCWQETVEHLASEQKWNVISMLIKKDSFAYGCNCSNVSISTFLKSWNKSLKLNKLRFVQALLENKARPNGLLNEEESPVMLCVKNHNYDIDTLMSLLEHGAYPSQLTINRGDTPLHAALRIAFAVSEHGAYPSQLTINRGDTPLHAALRIAFAVSEHGAYPSQLTINRGDTPLHAALRIAFAVSEHGAYPSQLTINRGDTPLHAALRIAFAVSEHGAYPSQLTINRGDTPLHAALRIAFAVSGKYLCQEPQL